MDRLEELDAVFETPDSFTPAQTEMYEIIVARLRQESAKLPLNTLQQLLIERSANLYVVMRGREKARVGATSGYQSATDQRRHMDLWLSVVAELNRMLSKDETVARRQLLEEVRSLILEGLDEVQDEALRVSLASIFSSKFEKAGL